MIYKTKTGGEVYAMKIDFKEDRPLPLWVKHEIHHGRLSRTDAGEGNQYFTIYNDNNCKGVRAYHNNWIIKNKSNRLFWMMNDDFDVAFEEA